MGVFDFFKKRKKQNDSDQATPKREPIDTSEWTGKDFEFLITGDVEISAKDYDSIMTPNSLNWTKTIKEGWHYYQINQDEFSYSWEMHGIQMTFNNEISFDQAKKIANEVIDNIKGTGQQAELVILDKTKVHKF